MTAHRAVMCGGAVKGKIVLVTGGAGSVGHSAIQIAKAAGARVFATVSTDQKFEIAQAAGADVIINYRTEDLKSRLLDEAPNGIDHVADVDFAAHAEIYPSVLKINASVGSYATATNLTPAIPFYPLAFRNILIQPIFVYSMSDEAKADAIADISRMLAKGQLTPRIAKTFDFKSVIVAHEAVEAGTLVGNAVVEVKG
ncbi:zinc-binding dehydrogenase [Pseudosulfitobacter sp. DSM 107133]|nr:zinc-binding dehydrogenase [Pseudosulfitobacter sp. DSM 107133]